MWIIIFLAKNAESGMSTHSGEMIHGNGTLKRNTSEHEDFDLSRFTDRQRPLNLERQRSCDTLSLSEMSTLSSPYIPKTDSYTRFTDHSDCPSSPYLRTVLNTPRSHVSTEANPSIIDAWENLRRSCVYFRGQPVGTIAALDISEEKLNYDQVKT